MTIQVIDQEITNIAIIENKNKQAIEKEIVKSITQRPNILNGTTYKLKSILTEHAMYITINNIEIDNKIYPFEIFINTKTLEHQQWIIALTRIISALFRYHVTYGTDITFMVKELKSIFDPNGGYIKKNRRIPSLVAEIADIIENHLIHLGTIDSVSTQDSNNGEKYHECPDCGNFSMTFSGGCSTCSVCGYSKCL